MTIYLISIYYGSFINILIYNEGFIIKDKKHINNQDNFDANPAGLFPKANNNALIIIAVATMISIILFSTVVFLIKDKEKIEHEAIFQEYQFQIVTNAAKTFENYLNNITKQSKNIVQQEIPNHNVSTHNQIQVNNILSQYYDDFMGDVSYIYIGNDQHIYIEKLSPAIDKIDFLNINQKINNINLGYSESYIPDFYISPQYQLASVYMPIYIKNKLDGYLITLIDLGAVAKKIIAPIRVGNFGAGFLLDQKGNVLFDHEIEIIAQNIFNDLHKQHPNILEWDKLVTTKKSGKSSYHFTIDRRRSIIMRKLASWDSFKYGDNKIIVAFSAPDDNVNQYFNTLQWIAISFASIFSLFIFIILGLFFKIRNRHFEIEKDSYKQDLQIFSKALVNSKSTLASVSAAYPDLGLIFDKDGIYLDVFGNKNLLTHTKKEVLGKRLIDIVPKNIANETIRKIALSLKYKKTIEYSYELYIKGKKYYFETKIAPIIIADEKPNKVILIVRDITRREEATNAANMALIHANKANNAKSEFLANISHELRTPLNAILGFAEIIKEQPVGIIDNQKNIEYAGHIFKSGGHLLSLLNDILDLSKIEAGKFILEEYIFNLCAVIDTEIAIIGSLSSKKHITLKYEGLEECIVKADEQAFRQILLNILSNAVKFSNEYGEINIKLSIDDKILFRNYR